MIVRTMTPEEFLAHCGLDKHYRDKGKRRLNRAAVAYRSYVLAYHCASLTTFYYAVRLEVGGAVKAAASDRDAGLEMVQVPEFRNDAPEGSDPCGTTGR